MGVIGYGRGKEDPWKELSSNTQLDKFNKAFNAKAAIYIRETLNPLVANLLASCSEVITSISAFDPQVINIQYPAAFSLEALRPEVKLEIGPLASWVPTHHYTIQSFAAEDFPELFINPTCTVTAITAERTFWEKATILHQQAHRADIIPAGYSRHYYDLYRLAESRIGVNALADLTLLRDVVTFKQRFYRSPWAHYETANPDAICQR